MVHCIQAHPVYLFHYSAGGSLGDEVGRGRALGSVASDAPTARRNALGARHTDGSCAGLARELAGLLTEGCSYNVK